MKTDPSDESLGALLRSWELVAEPGPRFSDGVRRRIAQRHAETSASPWRLRWREWRENLTGPTDFAWGMAAAVLLTAGAGWMGLRSEDHSRNAAPSSHSYLALVDPYRMNQ